MKLKPIGSARCARSAREERGTALPSAQTERSVIVRFHQQTLWPSGQGPDHLTQQDGAAQFYADMGEQSHSFRVFPGYPCRRCSVRGGWRCDAATLRRCQGLATLRRCDAATQDRPCDAVGAATLRRCNAARRAQRCDTVGAATLLALRRGRQVESKILINAMVSEGGLLDPP